MADVSRNGPNLWRAMLEELGLPGAVIAGGCIRDWQLGVEPKDIDIFVPMGGPDWDKSRKQVEALLFSLYDNPMVGSARLLEPGRYANPPEKQVYGTEYDEAFGKDVFGVLYAEMFDLPVNIIARTAHLEGPQALIDSFDFDILQAYHDGTRTHFSPGFLLACDKGVATMAHGRHIEQSIKRFLRFNARHPGRLSLNIPFDMEVDFV